MARKKATATLAPDPLAKMHEDLVIRYNNLALEMEQRIDGGQLSESLSDLDWANRIDKDFLWIRTSGANAPQFRYMTKEIIDMYADIAAFMAVYNPLVKRIVDVKTQFTFALDYSITSDTGQDTIDEIKKDDLNQQVFFGHQAIVDIDGELQKSGNVFIAIWPDKKQVRAWSNYEIRDIVTDSEDACRPLFYLRSWLDDKGSEHRKAYPSVFVQPGDMPTSKTALSHLGSNYEVDRDAVVYHLSAKKGIKQKFALSELVAVCRWARPHEQFLQDFAAIVQALRKYTHMMTTKGTASQASAIANQFKGDTNYMGTPLQSKPTGSMVVAQEGNDLRVVDAGSGKIVGIEGARSFLLMITAASGVPETYLTMDPSTGNLATAKQISPVFIMLIQERQTAWKNALTIVFKMLLDSDDFEVSFPPIRDNVEAYITAVNAIATLGQAGKWAGTLVAKDYLKAVYEALEWKLPDDDVLDTMAAALEASGAMPAELPGIDAGLDAIAQAANGLMEAVKRQREADEGQWVTIGGAHILIKGGESPADAFKRTTGKSLPTSTGSGSAGGTSGKGDSGSTPGKSGDTTPASSQDSDKALIKSMTKASNKKVGGEMAAETEKGLKEHLAYGQTQADNEDINNYTALGYSKMNYAMREGDTKPFEAQIGRMDKVIAGSPNLPDGTVLYRGVGERGVSQMMSMKPGDTCNDKAFQSFSTSPHNANQFTTAKTSEKGGRDKVIIRAITNNNVKGLTIGGGEHEILIGRGTSWKIVSNNEVKQDRLTRVHVITVVPA